MDGTARIERSAFDHGPDVTAVLDAAGTVVAVNTAWTRSARAGGADQRCGIGSDYVQVCRVGADRGAPGASRALRDVTAVLTHAQQRASSLYPFAGPGGLRWFRYDVFAIGGGHEVGVRHLDVTGFESVHSRRVGRASAPPTHHRDGGTVFLGGLEELLQQTRPPARRVLVMVGSMTEPDLDGSVTTSVVTQLAIEGAVERMAPSRGRVELVEPLTAHTLGVAVSASSLSDAVAAADALRVATDLSVPWRLTWGLALAIAGTDHAADLVGRARRASVEASASTDGSDVGVRRTGHDSTAELHRCARRLTDAATEFDLALDDGRTLPELVRRDQEVKRAEDACLDAAATLMGVAAHRRRP